MSVWSGCWNAASEAIGMMSVSGLCTGGSAGCASAVGVAPACC
jgi:hypothetical protein